MMMNYDKRTLEQALSMTREAAYQLEEAKGALSSARGWGVLDILGGKGLSTLIKHGRTGKAEEHISRATRLLDNVRRLIPEADCYGLEEDRHGVAKFADFFFDGALTDLYMQSCIKDRMEAVDDLLHRVRSMESMLKRYL